MTDAANNPDPLPEEDDTAWADPQGEETAQGDREEADAFDEAVEKNTSVLGTPD